MDHHVTSAFCAKIFCYQNSH